MGLRSVRGLATIVLTGAPDRRERRRSGVAGRGGRKHCCKCGRRGGGHVDETAIPNPPGRRRLARSLPRTADAATQAYLDRLPVDVVARSNDYFEGGYWLQLWNFLLGLGHRRVPARRPACSARMRDWAERVGRKPRPARRALRCAVRGRSLACSRCPLTIYQGYFREHQYGMATQSFGPWFASSSRAWR